MKLYLIQECAEECGPGSSPSIQVHTFSTPEKRLAFVADWNANQERPGRLNEPEKDDTEPNMYYRGGYTYWLEESEGEADKVFYYGRLYKEY